MEPKGLIIECDACGRETIVRREPCYEGFRKVGERILCAACGREFPDESRVPYKTRTQTRLFDESDRVATPDVLARDERIVNCRRCRHYVVNPFVQRCGRHNRFVEATDSCQDFEAPPDS